ncbi:MAG: DNA mismatch repair protein MutS [Clostridium sp.]
MPLSPMMQDYLNTKEKYSDCILLYRLGDFYEMFFEDAILISKELELTLTGKLCGLPEKAPMCGIPQSTLDTYVSRLIQKGFKVAICEQLENPKESKGIVKRGVVRVVTPGTVTEQNLLDEKKNNYIVTIIEENGYALSALDVTTGEFYVTTIPEAKDQTFQILLDEIARFSPKEIIISEKIKEDEEKLLILKEVMELYITYKSEEYFKLEAQEEQKILQKYNILKTNLDNDILFSKIDKLKETENEKKDSKEYVQQNIFDMLNIKSDEKDDEKEELTSKTIYKEENIYSILKVINSTLKYIEETQMKELKNVKNIIWFEFNKYMAIDKNTRRNLELTQRMKDLQKKGSLLHILDKTKTSMGARLLNRWVNSPLLEKKKIDERLDSVEYFKDNMIIRNKVRESLSHIYDIERIASKVAFSNINAKDVIALKNSIKYLPELKQILKSSASELLEKEYSKLDTLEDIYEIIDCMIEEEPPLTITEGGIIKEEFNEELKRLKSLGNNGREWIASLEASEREITGIKTLKVGYNRVFGYYIEVTNINKDKVPETYIRKQTLTNAERYVTPELKQIEEELINAETKIKELEYTLFLNLRDFLSKQIYRIMEVSSIVAKIDVLQTLAQVAEDNNYSKPQIIENGNIEIIEGRHPVVEKTLKNQAFISNNTYLDNKEKTISIITGPNMSGKSTYMRQNALITIMAQIGSFVPAESAKLPIIDKVFTRIGASDDLSQGKSTFMMEMTEVATILQNATKNSLILLDEIGRGTSTYDGMSIAKSVVEYISKNIKAKTLFATHYHELVEMEKEYTNIKNYHVQAKEFGKDIVFLRKIVEGGTDQSYGIHVARFAGVPEDVTKRAEEILKELEEKTKQNIKAISNNGMIINDKNNQDYENIIQLQKINQKLKNIDINLISPIEALNILVDLKKDSI